MKKVKILVSVLISMALLLALFVPAMAANYTITVNGKAGETYTVYKIFNVYASGNNGVYTADSGIVTLLNDKVDGLTFGSNHSDGKKVVTMDDNTVAEELAKYLKEHKSEIPAAYKVASSTIADGETTAKLTVSGAGYYFVDTTMGTLCMLNTVTSNITVTEKNDEVSVDKVIVGSSTPKENTVQIGDTVYFKTTITIPEGATNVVLHDKMEAGFTFGGSVTVKNGNTTLTSSDDYDFTTSNSDGCTFEIAFSSEYLDSITDTTTVTVTYSATLNEKAEIATSGTNDNKTWATYGAGQETTVAKTETKTYDFNLFKHTGTDTALAGAKFQLYSDSACTSTTRISLVKISDTSYRIAKPGESGTTDDIVSVSSAINIKGLSGDERYYLKETAAPAGYNMVNVVYEVSAADTKDVAFGGTLKVLNVAGTLLPTTGGTGTKVLFAVGGVLVVVAFVLFTSKRRMSAEG